ncbi:MAG: hypothetical protein ACLU4J_25525, partial [Butyricimonas paravirosa]
SGKLSPEGAVQVINAAGETLDYAAVNTFETKDFLFPGRTSPKYFGAWSNTVSCRGFEFDIMFTYKLGHKLRMPSIGNVYIQDRVYKTYDQRWRKPGDEETTWVPRSMYGSNTGFSISVMENIDRQIEKADLIRLKSVGLYDFKRLIKQCNFRNLKFSRRTRGFGRLIRWVRSGSFGNGGLRRVCIFGDQPTHLLFYFKC